MNCIIKGDEAIPFISEKMQGCMLLADGVTEQDEIDAYLEMNHINFFTPSGDGFLCVGIVDDIAIIPFAWHTGTFRSQKEMVKLGKELYQHYTVELGYPIYYTGLKNLYTNNSEEIEPNVWVFKPKNI